METPRKESGRKRKSRKESGRKRKSSEVEEASPAEADAYVSQVAERRETQLTEALLMLRSDRNAVNLNRDHLIQSVRALVTTNKEIWDYCEECRLKKNNVPGGIRLMRCVAKQIYVKTYEGTTSLSVTPELEVKEFKLPFSLPKMLLDILPPPTMMEADEVFPDFREFLENVFVLRDDVMVPYLAILQDHLEKIQVSLGAMNDWLLEPERCISFIQNHFSKSMPKITPDGVRAMGCCPDCEEEHEQNEVCVKCFLLCSEHDEQEEDRRCGFSHPCDHNPNGYETASYFTAESSVLKKVSSSGKFEEKFDISMKRGRDRIVKFLDFILTE